MSTTKFLNESGKINSLEINADSNTVVVKDSAGEITASFTNGQWSPSKGYNDYVLKNKNIYSSTLKDSYGKLSEVNQEKLSIYTSKNNVKNITVSNSSPTTIVDGEELSRSEIRQRAYPGGFGEAVREEDILLRGGKTRSELRQEWQPGFGMGKRDGSEVTNPKKAWKLKDLKDLNTVDFPTDPEGFYIGRYPINQKDTDNFDYLKITCYDYEPGLFTDDSSQSIFKIKDLDKRVKTRRGVVSLPIQPGISESNSVGWGDNELSPIKLAGANIAGSAMDFLSGGGSDSIENFKGTAVATAKEALGNNWEAIIKSYFAGQAVGANLIGRATGQTINKNVEVLFNGPNLRTFGYSYRFTPREPREAREIKEIIRFFKKSMAPKRSNSRIFLKSPNVFKLKYTFRNGDSHPFLNNIKICALNSFTVDYTPDGSYSTYDNEGGVGDGSMTSYQVSMSFMEMTPIYNDDFWSDDEGQEGTGF